MLAAHTSATDADRVAYKIFRAPDDLTFKVDGTDEAIWQIVFWRQHGRH